MFVKFPEWPNTVEGLEVTNSKILELFILPLRHSFQI